MDTDLLHEDLTSEHLKPFQVVGTLYALAQRRTFLADEQGLGKTRQAFTAVELAFAYPCVVVCPPALRGNWARELSALLPDRTVEVVTGNRPHPVSADYVICGYSTIKAWEPVLQPRSLIVDESHRVKEPKAQQSKAVKTLAEKVPADGLVLCLTGTPILNKPIELLHQLEVLGRLEEIVPEWAGRTSDPEFRFKWTYCRNERSKAESGHYTWDGAVSIPELHDKLRNLCYVRRERSSVLPELTDTHRVTTVLTLNGALADYRRAEKDLRSFLLEHKDEYAVDRALHAEALVMLGTLRQLAGLAKVETTVEYVQDWLEQNPTKSLVIFAWHRAVQDALVEAFACPHILGGEKDPEEQKRQFNERESRVIVCSIVAAKEGHTLVAGGACSDALFVEMGWNPGTHSQAEDRINRIGRTASDVFANYLIAADTVDEWVYGLVEFKRQVFDALVRGSEAEVAEEESVQMAVLEKLAS